MASNIRSAAMQKLLSSTASPRSTSAKPLFSPLSPATPRTPRSRSSTPREGVQRKALLCVRCGAQFDSRYELISHKRSAHPNVCSPVIATSPAVTPTSSGISRNTVDSPSSKQNKRKRDPSFQTICTNSPSSEALAKPEHTLATTQPQSEVQLRDSTQKPKPAKRARLKTLFTPRTKPKALSVCENSSNATSLRKSIFKRRMQYPKTPRRATKAALEQATDRYGFPSPLPARSTGWDQGDDEERAQLLEHRWEHYVASHGAGQCARSMGEAPLEPDELRARRLKLFAAKQATRNDELAQLVQLYGVAPKFRRDCWLSWSNAQLMREKNFFGPTFYQACVTAHAQHSQRTSTESDATISEPQQNDKGVAALLKQMPNESELNQIEVDITRTCPTHPYFKKQTGLDTLRRLLVALTVLHSDVGYTQSMNFVAGFLLLVCAEDETMDICNQNQQVDVNATPHVSKSEEDAFWLAAALVDRLRDYYSEGMTGLKADSATLKQLLADHMPKLAALMEKHMMAIEILTPPWFMCLFFTWLPAETTARLWDLVFWAGRDARGVLLWAALALLKLAEPKMLSVMDSDECELPFLMDTIKGTARSAAAFSTLLGADIGTPADFMCLDDVRSGRAGHKAVEITDIFSPPAQVKAKAEEKAQALAKSVRKVSSRRVDKRAFTPRQKRKRAQQAAQDDDDVNYENCAKSSNLVELQVLTPQIKRARTTTLKPKLASPVALTAWQVDN